MVVFYRIMERFVPTPFYVCKLTCFPIQLVKKAKYRH